MQVTPFKPGVDSAGPCEVKPAVITPRPTQAGGYQQDVQAPGISFEVDHLQLHLPAWTAIQRHLIDGFDVPDHQRFCAIGAYHMKNIEVHRLVETFPTG